jgi:hypothetical protein
MASASVGTAQFVKTINDPGRHADGGGLYLEVEAHRKSWRNAKHVAQC